MGQKVLDGGLIGTLGQMLTCKLKGKVQNITWFLSAVYVDCNPIIRKELWGELTTIRNTSKGPWVVFGYFNVTRYPNERTDSHYLSREMTKFTDWINEMGVI